MPGLARADRQNAVRDAAIVEAINKNQYPGQTATVSLESEPGSGTVTARIQGRAATGLTAHIANQIHESFPGVVKSVLGCSAMKEFVSSKDALNRAVDLARELVRSDSVARKAIIGGSCSACPKNTRPSL